MNTGLEEMLRRMPLRGPSPRLDGRVVAKARGARLAAGILAAGAMAAAAAILALAPGRGPVQRPEVAKAPAPIVQPPGPERQEENWSQLQYVGTIPQDDGLPLRAFSQQTVRQVRWVDKDRGVTVEVIVPKEKIIFVAAETY